LGEIIPFAKFEQFFEVVEKDALKLLFILIHKKAFILI